MRGQVGDGRNQTHRQTRRGGWVPCTSRNTRFQREVDKSEAFQRETSRRVKGLEVVSHEKLGMLSLEKTEKKVMEISSSIFKLLHD